MIIPMKKVSLFALKNDREKLLLALQRAGEVMLIPEEASIPSAGDTEAQLARSEQALRFVNKYKAKSGFFEDRPQVDYAAFMADRRKGAALEEKALSLSEQLNAIHAEQTALTAKMDTLLPWLPLDAALNELKPTRHTRLFTGFCGTGGEAVKAAAEKEGAFVQLLKSGPDGQAALIICHESDEIMVADAIKTAGFSTANPPRYEGTAKAVYDSAQKRLAASREEEAALKAEAEKLAKEQTEFQILYDKKRADYDRETAAAYETEYTFYLTGWVREDRVEKVKKAVAKAADIYELDFTDPAEDEQPPTVTKNNRFVTQFETITDMFSRPGRGDVDPNPTMGPWYWIIFGLMMGDAGYGLLMAVVLFAFLKLKKPRGDFGKLVRVMLYSSVTTMIWGVVFGSYFGETFHPLLFAPLDNPMMMLIFCLGIGVLHIFTGMAVKMYADIRAGHVWDAIFDQLSWMVLIAGAALLFLPATSTVGMVMAIAGAVTILLTAGRKKPGVFGKITGGLLGLYNITGYASDILSYSRILALSLATGVVGMVMNLLAGMLQGSIIGFVFSLLVYIVGHAFNLAMGLLSAYVHDSRLQYIEFFGKFYEGGGYAFKPLSVDTKYVDVVDETTMNV